MSGLWQGMLMGFAVAMPFGPVCLLCITHTVHRGFWFGMVTGLAAAIADVIFAFFGGMGIKFLDNWMGDLPILPLVGIALLTYLGIKSMRSSKVEEVHEQKGYLRAFVTTLGLTLSCPITILVFSAFFAVSEISLGTAYVGIFVAAMAWYTVLALAATRLTRFRTLITRLSGILLLGIAAFNLGKIALTYAH